MITWSSKRFIAPGFIILLGACDATGTNNTLLAGLSPPQDAALPAVPLTQALMMRGKVTLVPPTGYCIDPESLSQNFALMARCDSLGAATSGKSAPIGVLTVSFARSDQNSAMPSAQDLAAAASVGRPEAARQGDASVVFKTKGVPPSPDLSSTHWRAVARVGEYTMGASLFGPEGRRAISNEGATVLEELIKRTTNKTVAG